MPPWHIDRNVGITRFKDDPSLSKREVDTILRWVDAGARPGARRAAGVETSLMPNRCARAQPSRSRHVLTFGAVMPYARAASRRSAPMTA